MTSANDELHPEYRALVNQLVQCLPPGWEYAQLLHRALGDHVECAAIVQLVTGEMTKWTVPAQVVERFWSLRKSMASPETGAWFSAKLEMKYPEQSRFRTNATDEPRWTTPPPASAHSIELTRHPRATENVPDWFPRT